MAEDINRHFSKENIDGQQTHEKMFKITNYLRNAEQNYNAGFPGGSVVKNLPASAGDTGLILNLGRSHMPQDN